MTAAAAETLVQLVRAAERVSSIHRELSAIPSMGKQVLEVVPELKPEIDAITARVLEAMGHVVAALEVLSAKVDVL